MPTNPSIAVGRPISTAEVIQLPTARSTKAPKAKSRVSIDELLTRGWPKGLCSALEEGLDAFPLRFVVVDNSGSMQMPDGKRMVQGNGTMRAIHSTRWEELGDLCNEVADIADTLKAPTHFHFLNPSPQGQYFAVGDDGSSLIGNRRDATFDILDLHRALAGSPTGGTPLTEAVQTIHSLIAPHASKLTSQGKQAVVVLATDGLPSNPRSFMQALQALQSLPVWIIVRLCTNESEVVEYWSDLDKHLERPLETLDDLRSEAREAARVNPWLSYAPCLQLARLMGLKHKLFDMIDERRLVPSQIKQVIERLFGCELPEPELDMDEFVRQVALAQAQLPTVYNPMKGRMTKWIDVDELRRDSPTGAFPGCCVS